MKKYQINKTALTATIFLTMLFSCKKDTRLLPDKPDSPQSTVNASNEEKLSAEQLKNEENLTRLIMASTSKPFALVNGLRQFQKPPILFKPFEMVDKNGAAISPTKVLTLSSGQKVTAGAFFTRLNSIEKHMNESGLTLRSNEPEIVSETITEPEYLDGMVAQQPQPIGDLRTDKELDIFMNPVKKVGNLFLKPIDEYSDDEKKSLDGYIFREAGDKLTATQAEAAPLPGPAVIVNPVVLKRINSTYAKEWSLGKPETFKTFIRGELNCQATIYQFDPQNPGKSMSEFKVTGTGKIGGTVFTHTFNLLNAKAEFYAPASLERKMTAKITVDVTGRTILPISKSYSQKTVMSGGDKSWDMEKAYKVTVPTAWFDFTGRLGVSGTVGLRYGATLGRGYVSAEAIPFGSINGYAEAGVDFLGVVGGGVGGEMVFVEGNLDLRGSSYLALQNARQIIVGGSYYVGSNLTLLKGGLYCYIKICPLTDFFDFLPCYQRRHYFWNWKGYPIKGTLYQGDKAYTIANL